ncbi:MAG: HAMP domain-containing protein, partial [Desulfovibrionales bacterium]
MPQTSLRLRIMLWFWGLLLAVFIPLYFFLAQTVRTDLVNHGQERATRQLEASCWLFSTQSFPDGEAGIQRWLTELGERLDVRMTYTINGRVAADSHVSDIRLPQVEDHALRPEIVQAARGQVGMDIRHSATIGRDLIYVAQSCPAQGVAEGDSVLRLALPMSNLYEQLETLKKRFFTILAVCLLISLLLSFWFSKNLLASIKNLVQLVSAVGAGAYDRRLHVSRASEFYPLVEAVNTMAQAISSHIKDVQEQKNRLQALFNGMSEAVMAVGRDGRIISVNPAFRRFFPKIQSIEGKTLLEATLEPELGTAMQRILRELPEHSEGLLLRRSGGAELEARINTYEDPSGGLQAVIVIQDVSLPRRMEKIRR